MLKVVGLTVQVHASGVGWADAVSEVSLEVRRGESVGVVGESGCGKSLTVAAVLGLLPEGTTRQTAGSISVDGALLEAPEQFAAVRGARLGYVAQDAATALNPVLTIGSQVAETARYHLDLSASDARKRAVHLLERVGLRSAVERFGAYPHQLSGGQQQRVMLACALAGDPELLLLDEPTTALDVTVQARVLRLLAQLRADHGLAQLLVTHDLAVASVACDRIVVLYGGRVVETGPTAAVLGDPKHPYTRGLLASLPSVGQRRLSSLYGSVPDVGQWPSGCRFRDRCPQARVECARALPALERVGLHRHVACPVVVCPGVANG